MPIKNYSSGMHMRLGFAIAANLDPDILLLDEIFAVGDADFQQRCIDTVEAVHGAGQDDHLRLARRRRRSARSAGASACSSRASWLFDGDVEGGLAFYSHLLDPAAARVESPAE